MSEPAPQVAIDIGNTYGATFIGLILSAMYVLSLCWPDPFAELSNS